MSVRRQLLLIPVLLCAALGCTEKAVTNRPEVIYVDTAPFAVSGTVLSAEDPPGAELLNLNAMTDSDGSAYYALYKDGFVNGSVYKIDESIDISACRIDPTYAQPAGPHTFTWTAPSGKYAIVVKPKYSIIYMFRIKGTGGDYDGWTPSAAGGTDKTGRNRIFKAVPVRMTDHDGEDTMVMGRLQTRAFLHEDGGITVFVINMGPESYRGYNVVLHGRDAHGEAGIIQWRDDTPVVGAPVKPHWGHDTLMVDLPSRSITEIQFASD